MNKLKKESTFAPVNQICARHQIEIKEVESPTGSFNKKIFAINQNFLLRLSESPMSLEQQNFRRVAALDFVPQLLHAGEIESDTGRLYYTLLTLLPGDDFVNAYAQTTLAQQARLGQAVAEFLDNLQQFTATDYDIGLYIPIIPHFSGSWREGHQRYWEILEQEAAELRLKPDSLQVFARAFKFLRASADALDFEAGPKLLHNDLHPKNLLLYQGAFSGVIDWECSQFGEADFELCHLIHWCVYPPRADIDFRPFLRAVFQAKPKCTQVPHLAQRLTIYQIEHEIQQIIWHGYDAASLRMPRLEHWLTGGVDDLLREIAD